MYPLNTVALCVEHTADVLAVKSHHTTVNATLESPLLSKPMVFLNALMFGYPARLSDADSGLERHAIHPGYHVLHTASFRLVSLQGLQSCTQGCTGVALAAC
jgi:hypothetical protein